MSEAELERLRADVFADRSSMEALLAIDNKADFIAAVVALASGKSLEVNEVDVENAMLAGRRSWIERWI